MKLSEYINYRKECPFCGNSLATYFKAKRKQNIYHMDGRLMAVLEMNGLSKGEKDYKVGYSFGLDDNSVQIEFLGDSDNMMYESVPVRLIEKFREFHKNSGGLGSWFTRNCTHPDCKRYFNGTKPFRFGPKLSDYSEIELGFEDFFLTIPIEDGMCKVVILANKSFSIDESLMRLTDATGFHSEVTFWRGPASTARYDQPMGSGRTTINVPLIPFVSVEETTQRVNTLLTFY